MHVPEYKVDKDLPSKLRRSDSTAICRWKYCPCFLREYPSFFKWLIFSFWALYGCYYGGLARSFLRFYRFYRPAFVGVMHLQLPPPTTRCRVSGVAWVVSGHSHHFNATKGSQFQHSSGLQTSVLLSVDMAHPFWLIIIVGKNAQIQAQALTTARQNSTHIQQKFSSIILVSHTTIELTYGNMCYTTHVSL